jgi:hypothetical protein
MQRSGDAQVENFERAGELIDEEGHIEVARQTLEAKEKAILEHKREVEAKDHQARLRVGAIEAKEQELHQRHGKVALCAHFGRESSSRAFHKAGIAICARPSPARLLRCRLSRVTARKEFDTNSFWRSGHDWNPSAKTGCGAFH